MWIKRLGAMVVLVVSCLLLVWNQTQKATANQEVQEEVVSFEENEQEIVETIQFELISATEPTVEQVEIFEFEPKENYVEVVDFEGRQYTIPYIFQNKKPGVTESGYVEQITEIPLYIQHYYRDVRYGRYGTVASHGCGICCMAMAYTYLLDKEITPEYLASEYGRYNTKVGSDWGVFLATAEDLGLTVEKTHQWDEALEALEDGKLVIAQAGSKSVFTDGGHFILLYGLTEDGKILIKDPSIYNYGEWSGTILKEGFQNGFNHENVKYSCSPFWIYEKKDLEAIAARAEGNS